MKSDLVIRAGGICIPGLTDEIVKRLPQPYDLIMEWTKYVDLDRALRFGISALIAGDKPTGDKILLAFSEFGFDEDDVVLPTDLFERTCAYTMQRVHLYGYSNLFCDDRLRRAVTVADVMGEIFAILRQSA
jgi:hypothetical protein